MSNPELKYRPDIDGLRAFAVISVIIFHYFPQFLPGGFVGVDIFFVISGYLVTSIIYSEVKQNKFSFSQFYMRRIRRLIPGLLFMMGLVLVAGWLLFLAEEFADLGKQITAGLLFFSNFLFYFESGYFEKSSILKPLLHLWSLGVEEQFYIFCPLLIYLITKLSKIRMKFILILLFAASFIFNFLYIQLDQLFVFYMLPGRLWELFAGSILAVHHLDSTDKISNNRLKNSFSIVGTITLIFSVYFIKEGVHFPGLAAAAPVLGSILFIAAGPQAFINRILSLRYIVYIGLISYPLYLLHWPALSFANIIFSQEVGNVHRILLLFFTFSAAAFSFQFIENPLRQKAILPKHVFTYLCFIVAFLIAGLSVYKLEGLQFRYREIEAARQSKLKDSFNEFTVKKGLCLNSRAEFCSISDSNKEPTVALLGDSHAASLYFGINKFFPQKNENVILVATAGVAPLTDVLIQGLSARTDADENFNFVLNLKSVHTVILSAFWASYYEEFGVEFLGVTYKNNLTDKTNAELKSQKEIFKKSLSAGIKKIRDSGKNIIFINDILKVPFKTDKCLSRPLLKATSDCQFSKIEALQEQTGYRESVLQILNQYSGLKIFDPVQILCPDEICEIKKDGKFIYTDSHHLSRFGSELVAEKLILINSKN